MLPKSKLVFECNKRLTVIRLGACLREALYSLKREVPETYSIQAQNGSTFHPHMEPDQK